MPTHEGLTAARTAGLLKIAVDFGLRRTLLVRKHLRIEGPFAEHLISERQEYRLAHRRTLLDGVSLRNALGLSPSKNALRFET